MIDSYKRCLDILSGETVATKEEFMNHFSSILQVGAVELNMTTFIQILFQVEKSIFITSSIIARDSSLICYVLCFNYVTILVTLYQEILKCLYLIIVMIFDAFILLELIQNLIFPFNLISSIFFAFLLLFFENKIYNRIWGKNGKWSINKYKKKIKK